VVELAFCGLKFFYDPLMRILSAGLNLPAVMRMLRIANKYSWHSHYSENV